MNEKPVDNRISLCIIVGNESPVIRRMLDSFTGIIDELCVVVATGSLEPDDTLDICKRWARENARPVKWAFYRNEGWTAYGGAVDFVNPATWPHVDNFGSARNQSWNLATMPWQIWADADDILALGSAEVIRNCAANTHYDCWYYYYQNGAERGKRERLIRRGTFHWQWALHENMTSEGIRKEEMLAALAPFGRQQPARGFSEHVCYIHAPEGDRRRNFERNERILARARHNTWVWHYYHAKDKLLNSQNQKDAKTCHSNFMEGKSIAQMALSDYRMEKDFKVDLMLTLAQATPSLDESRQWALAAFGLDPRRREPLAYLALCCLDQGKPHEGLAFAWIFGVMPNIAPNEQPFGYRPSVYQYEGAHIFSRCARAAGREEMARHNETKLFTDAKGKITLCHATRNRPMQAQATRDFWYRRASNPGGVEHIFAVDNDDREMLGFLEKTGFYHTIVEAGGGCVRAWNAAAEIAKGEVIIQVSDDFFPPQDWDRLILERIGDTTKAAVLAVSDGFRQDGLMCIAIATKARIAAQEGGTLFWPEYKSMYSDNEFSVRALVDGVVIPARDLIFAHHHPIAMGIPAEKWDETYRISNADERYQEGSAIFLRRNQEQLTALKKLNEAKP